MRITLLELKRIIRETIESDRPLTDDERHERVGYGFLGTIEQDRPDVDADLAFNGALDAVSETLGCTVAEARRVLDSNLGRHLADGISDIDSASTYGSVYDSVAAQVRRSSFRRDAVRVISAGR